HLYVRRSQEAPVGRCDLARARLATRQTNGGIQFLNDVISGGANSRNRFADAIGFRNRIVDGMAQLAKQALQVVVELQGASLPYSTYRNCRRWSAPIQVLHRPRVIKSSAPEFCVRIILWKAPLRQ